MHHILVVKAAHHVHDGIGFADVSQKLVAQTFTFRRTCHQPGDINELHNGRLHALRFDDLGQSIQPRIWHFHNADVRLNGAKRIVLGSNTRLGQGVE